MKNKSKLLEIALVFLKLGTFGFGGPPALIALMETEMVHKRQWVSRKLFMDMLAAINLVPGPNAVEMAIYLGYVHAGYLGLVIGGICFLIPAFIITLFFSIGYAKWGVLPQIQVIFSCIAPFIIAIIFASAYRIGKSALKNPKTILIALGCFVAFYFGFDGIYLVMLAGMTSLIIYIFENRFYTNIIFIAPFISSLSIIAININDKLLSLGLYFLKIGAVLFGGGFALFAYIQDDVVNRFQWLTEKQLLDAITIGQITPGPVSSAATFIGYLVKGVPGALVASVAIFVPSFIIVLIVGRFLPRLRKSIPIQQFLDGVNAAVVILIVTIGISFIKLSSNDLISLTMVMVGLFALIKFKMDPIWLIICGTLIGLIKLI